MSVAMISEYKSPAETHGTKRQNLLTRMKDLEVRRENLAVLARMVKQQRQNRAVSLCPKHCLLVASSCCTVLIMLVAVTGQECVPGCRMDEWPPLR